MYDQNTKFQRLLADISGFTILIIMDYSKEVEESIACFMILDWWEEKQRSKINPLK